MYQADLPEKLNVPSLTIGHRITHTYAYFDVNFCKVCNESNLLFLNSMRFFTINNGFEDTTTKRETCRHTPILEE